METERDSTEIETHSPVDSEIDSDESATNAPSTTPDRDAARGTDGIPLEPTEDQISDQASGSKMPRPPLDITGSEITGFEWLTRVGVHSASTILVVVLVLFLIGIAQRTGWISAGGFSADGETMSSASKGDQTQRYICPMMCTPPLAQPGRCPVCGMELVEANGGGGGDGKSVIIEPSARRLVGIQTALSKMGLATRTLRTIGSIDFDESRLSTISAYIDGRLEQLYADYVGVRVSQGDDLALIYSPQLYSAQTEFITSLDGGKIGRFDLGDAALAPLAREKLSELGMTDSQIETLEKTRTAQPRIRIKSPQSGTVIEKTSVEGDYVKTGQKLYRIADVTSVWLMLDLFPDDAAAVRFGQEVEAEIQSVQGEVFTGRVAFIDPTVNPKTRTVRVRVEVMNLDRKLRPGDYATARITMPAIATERVYDPALAGKYISPMHPQVIRDEPGPCPLCGMDLVPTSTLGFSTDPIPEQRVVTVPRDAVLLAGDGAVIYVETKPGRFEIRRVTVGPMTDTQAVIISGLAEGETVATGGNFLIDSQMQLAGNPSLLDPSRAPRFPPGPLELSANRPSLLQGEAGLEFDRAYNAYFEIQTAMAADQPAPPLAMRTLRDALARLQTIADVPNAAQHHIARARTAAESMGVSLESARAAYRTVSRSLLKVAVIARGPKTASSLSHYYCPMVPGGGGDWMQMGGPLANPYWGSEMLRCGEVVQDLSIESGEN